MEPIQGAILFGVVAAGVMLALVFLRGHREYPQHPVCDCGRDKHPSDQGTYQSDAKPVGKPCGESQRTDHVEQS